MTPEDVHHLRAVGRATASGIDYFGRLAEVRAAPLSLFHILAAKVVEAMW